VQGGKNTNSNGLRLIKNIFDFIFRNRSLVDISVSLNITQRWLANINQLLTASYQIMSQHLRKVGLNFIMAKAGNLAYGFE